ncbi:MAG: ABC transporter ATP-binding protein [Chloroflexi bacterium]|nr:ABC transporter ATP-binding protein [Chloroflexota bacterium]
MRSGAIRAALAADGQRGESRIMPPVDTPRSDRASRAPVSKPDADSLPDPAIELLHVGKRFDETWVVRGLDTSVPRGVIFGLFGPSGSGKTTILRLILGLLAPNEGSVRVLGADPREMGDRARSRIGYMPQRFVLFPELSVGQNLQVVASLYSLHWSERQRAIRQALDLVQLSDERHKRASRLSGGMKRRLELAAALLHQPDLIVVDEPTAGVDPVLRERFWQHFHRLRDQGRTFVLTSQYVTEAEYCDRVAILGDGQFIATGTPDQVRSEALGGEIVQVTAEGVTRHVIAALARLPYVRSVKPLTFDKLRLSVDDSGVAIPQLIDALEQLGISAPRVEVQQPNFDEVFVRLMERHGVSPRQ